MHLYSMALEPGDFTQPGMCIDMGPVSLGVYAATLDLLVVCGVCCGVSNTGLSSCKNEVARGQQSPTGGQPPGHLPSGRGRPSGLASSGAAAHAPPWRARLTPNRPPPSPAPAPAQAAARRPPWACLGRSQSHFALSCVKLTCLASNVHTACSGRSSKDLHKGTACTSWNSPCAVPLAWTNFTGC